MRWRKLLVWIMSVGGALALISATAILSSPLWIDAQIVKARVIELVARSTGGHTHFERIDLHFLPMPGVTLIQPRFSLPGLLDLEAQTAAVDLDLIALFAARVEPGTLRIDAPAITVQLPDPTQNGNPLSIERAEEVLRGVFKQIAKLAPAIEVAIDDGSLSLQSRGRRPLSFENVQLRAETEHERIDATVSCTSYLWERLTLKMTNADSKLTGHGTVEVVGLRAHDLGEALGDVLGQNEDWPVHEAIVDTNLQWQIKGLTDIRLKGNVSASNVSLRFGERHLDLVSPTIDLSAQLRNGATEISVRQLVVEIPRLDVTGKLTRTDQGTFALQAQVANADLSALLTTAAQLAPEIDVLARPPLQFERGTITSAQVRSEAATFVELFEPTTLHAQIELSAVDALARKYDLQFREFGASGSLEAGKLEVHSISGRIGNSLLRDGHLTATLSDDFMVQRADLIAQRGDHVLQGTDIATLIGKHITLGADVVLSLDLAENLVLAKRVIRDRKTRRELKRVKKLAGRAEVHAITTISPQQRDVRFDVSLDNVSARHAAVPYPIRIKHGAVRYSNGVLDANDLEGSVGRTTFKGVGARLGIDAPYALSAGKGSARIAVEELMQWAATRPKLAPHLDGIEKVTGTMEMSASKFGGPLLNPENLSYVLAVSPKQVSIEAQNLGPRVEIDGGVIDVTHSHIRVHGVKVSALDTTMTVTGKTDAYRNGLKNIRARLDGFLGLKSLGWLRDRAGMPDDFRFGSQLQLSNFDAQWQRDGGFALNGKIEVSDGPTVDVAMSGSPDHIEVKSIGLRDDISDVEFGGRVEGTLFTLRFKGKLAGQSVARIFAQMPFEFGELTGDIRANGDWKHPGRGAVDGVLGGKMIGIPEALLFTMPVPVMLEKFSLDGKERTLSIKTATFALGDSRLHVSGSVNASGEKFQLDVDVRGDHVVIPLSTEESRPQPSVAPKADEIEKAESTIDEMAVEADEQLAKFESILEQIPGSVRIQINIAQLEIGRWELKPFIATASLEDEQLALRLQHVRVCNILLTSGWKAKIRGHASLNVEVHTRDTPIERSIACLTNHNILMTGLMDVDAKVVASGSGTEYLDNLRVTYALSTRDGVIRKFDALEEVIVAVNETEAADGKLPDMDESSLKYKIISAKGNIDLRTLRFDEIVVDIDGAKIMAQGRVEIPTQKISATVLVAPMTTINKIIDRLPILGRIFGGSVLAVPVGVSGTIESPVVLPLAPAAVANRLLNIFTNTLKLPVDLVNTESPKQKETNTSGK